MTNNQIIQKALEILREQLAPYILQQLQQSPLFRTKDAWWERGVIGALSDRNLTCPSDDGTYESRVGSLDISMCLNLLDYHWKDIFLNKLGGAARSWAKEIKEYRNRWAHFGSKPFTDEETRRAIDTMEVLAGAFDVETKQELMELYAKEKSVEFNRDGAVVVKPGLLTEGRATGAVTETNLTRKLTVDGVTQTFPVYKIRLDQLYYNDQNDRIATWLSQYNSEHPDSKLNPDNREEYNALLESFIVASNPEAITKTQNNIELVDQREPGVVLTDGRIVDGNRRFTCLRRLAQKSERFGSMEAIILDRDIEHSAKQIKMLELSIQHGEESKVEYNTVDRLFGVYNDVEVTHLLTVAEYARSTNETEARVQERIDQAKVMTEFLEYIHAPGQYHLIREMDLGSALDEISKLLKRASSDEERKAVKRCVFANLLIHPSADQRRTVRDIKAILASDYAESYLEEQSAIAQKVETVLPESGQMTSKVVRDVLRGNDELKQEMEASTSEALKMSRKTETRNRPIQLLEKATMALQEIDGNIFAKMNDSEIKRARRQIELLKETIKATEQQMERS